ncbi:hypothetical protein LshimejAT787_0803480 [Lyophyllum shimeji]|uniref:Uncharacterized protein n=1 Tax=Lyophyllum shimeji TaxID=47721 RepID=A0A9P3PPX8_LYOSH|nr:hypothetical protein LshimejAT787_0803480 [Lyophyllum shimeji]
MERTQFVAALGRSLHIRQAYLPLFLFIPVYYASQASPVLRLLEGVLGNEERASTSPSIGSSQAATTTLAVVLDIVRPDPAHLRRHATYDLPTTSTIHPATLRLLDDLKERFRMAWCTFMDSRNREWALIAKSACTFAAASSGILQIPGMTADPIIRGFVFLAIFRALAAALYAAILLHYFRQPRTRTAHFAVLWLQRHACHRSPARRYTSWTMFSLPAVAFCWGVILMILTLVCSIWRDPPEFMTYPVNGGHHRPLKGTALRTLITVLSLLDLGGAFWTWKTLSAFND